jgi:hypothetical protein
MNKVTISKMNGKVICIFQQSKVQEIPGNFIIKIYENKNTYLIDKPDETKLVNKDGLNRFLSCPL